MAAVSLIVPIYNVAPWLPACLDSIAAQTFTDFELILVDDGSTDQGGILCDRFAAEHPWAKVIHQSNQGLSGARNTGLDAAAGEYIAFLDSDDLISPTFLEELYTACRSSGAQMALCGVEDVLEDGSSQQPPAFTLPEKAGVFTGKELLNEFYVGDGTCYTVAWNKLYHASLWDGLRYPVGKIHEDDALAHLLYCRCPKVVCLKQPLYFYRLRQGSICRTELRPSAFDGLEALVGRYRFFLKEGMEQPLVQKALANCWRRYFPLYFQVAQQPTPELAQKLARWQKEMRALPLSPYMTWRERLTALRLSRFALPRQVKERLQ